MQKTGQRQKKPKETAKKPGKNLARRAGLLRIGAWLCVRVIGKACLAYGLKRRVGIGVVPQSSHFTHCDGSDGG